MDLLAAYSFAPEPILHQAMLAIHTAAPDEPKKGTRRSSRDEEWATTLYAAAGVVQLPSLWYHGVEEGRSVALHGEIRFGTPSVGGKLFVRRNDPEFLAAFPFGQNAINTGFAVHVSEGL